MLVMAWLSSCSDRTRDKLLLRCYDALASYKQATCIAIPWYGALRGDFGTCIDDVEVILDIRVVVAEVLRHCGGAYVLKNWVRLLVERMHVICGCLDPHGVSVDEC